MNLNAQGLQSLEHIHAFLEGTRNLGFEVPFHNREATYDWVAGELCRFGYTRLGQADLDAIGLYRTLAAGI